MCHWYSQKDRYEEKFLIDFRFSDDAHFPLIAHVNSKNSGKRETSEKLWTQSALKGIHVMGRYLEAWHHWNILLCNLCV